MAILKVSQMGHPVLRKKCRKLSVKEIRSEQITKLVEDMWETLDEYEGVGLAAPQVYQDISLALVGTKLQKNRYGKDSPKPNVIFNASYKGIGKRTVGVYEGCLSIPGIRGFVPRFGKIEVSYQDQTGKKCIKKFSGFEAIVYQHEIDHLNGILFFDRCEMKTLAFESEFKRFFS